MDKPNKAQQVIKAAQVIEVATEVFGVVVVLAPMVKKQIAMFKANDRKDEGKRIETAKDAMATLKGFRAYHHPSYFAEVTDEIDKLTKAKASVAKLDEQADTLADMVATTEDALTETESALDAAKTEVKRLTKEKEQADSAAAKAEEEKRNRRASIRAKARGKGGESGQPAKAEA